MNLQQNRSGAMKWLCRLWDLTPTNEALALAYLTDDQAEERLLPGAEGQVFSRFDWRDRQEICGLLQEVASPDDTQRQAKVLRLLWAIGRSTAGFAVLFEEENLFMVGDDVFRQRCEVLGTAAAAAMDAEYPAAWPSGYDQTRQLARTHPEALLEAQRLIADPQNSMAGGVLAGVLLAAGSPEKKQPGLLAKLLGGTSGWSDSLLKGQVEVVLSRVEATLIGEDSILLSDGDASQLTAYLRAGDPTAPVPATSFPNTWQSDPLDYFSRLLVSISLSDAVKCIAPAVLFGLGRDPRMACAMRVLTGVDPCEALWGCSAFCQRTGRWAPWTPCSPTFPVEGAHCCASWSLTFTAVSIRRPKSWPASSAPRGRRSSTTKTWRSMSVWVLCCPN